MKLEIKAGTIFDAPSDARYVYFVSGDYTLDNTLTAQALQQRYGFMANLCQMYPLAKRVDIVATSREMMLKGQARQVLKPISYRQYMGKALAVCKVFCLVVREEYWMGTTEQSLFAALTDLKRICITTGVRKLAMPKSGNGLDRMSWITIANIIQKVFDNTEVEITVYDRRRKKPEQT